MSQASFESWGVLYLDHLAVTSSDFGAALRDYLALPGSRLVKGPASNPTQKLRYAFVQLLEGITIEILTPEPNSPLCGHIERGGGPYHFCFAVKDIGEALKTIKNEGARVIVDPTPDVAFDGRKIAFFYHPTHGIMELVEAYPALNEIRPVSYTPPKKDVISSQNIVEKLDSILLQTLPSLDKTTILDASMNNTKEWDSIKHLQLMMEIENQFSITISSNQLMSCTDYQSINTLIVKLCHDE